jgi:hypothetical protein
LRNKEAEKLLKEFEKHNSSFSWETEIQNFQDKICVAGLLYFAGLRI